MKIDKEYPATHSMSTAWYCVDEEGNVGIFDIDDNGPVPVGGYTQNDVNEVFWEDFSINNEGGIKDLHLNPDQILQMLEPSDDKGTWEKSNYGDGWTNIKWSEVIIKIDTSKLDVLMKAYSLDKSPFHHPICLSKSQGLYYVDFFSNKDAVDMLEENNVILEKYKAPYYNTPYDEDDEEQIKRFKEENKKFPLFIYMQDYWPFASPAIRVAIPEHPMKIDQLPQEIQEKLFHMPVLFKEKEQIQLAEYLPVTTSSVIPTFVYDDKLWRMLKMTDGTNGYYNEELHKLIKENDMQGYLNKGEAEEFDYHNERHYALLTKERG